MRTTLKIAIVVHGRFHAFDLTRALIERGHDVTLFTNYPKRAVRRFGISSRNVRSFWRHGIVSRVAWSLNDRGLPYPEAWLHRMFGRWAAQELSKDQWDVIHQWSGVSEEALRQESPASTLRLLVRGSAHIRAQARLLAEETVRTGVRQEKPSPWMIEREEVEYDLADRIVVLSRFCYDTFVDAGITPARVCVVVPGAQLEVFRPSESVVEERCRRIMSGAPLRVINVGTFSFRKGMWDMAAVIRELDPRRFEFRFVGPIAGEAAGLAATIGSAATFVPKQRQRDLPASYAWGDVFVLPTIEDGFQTVLSQASASALPILTTPNGAGHDLVLEGRTGWVLPIRHAPGFIERLQWCDAHRAELAEMVRRLYRDLQPRSWADAAADFERVCFTYLDEHRPSRTPAQSA